MGFLILEIKQKRAVEYLFQETNEHVIIFYRRLLILLSE